MANNIVQSSHDWLRSPHMSLLAWSIPQIAVIAGLFAPIARTAFWIIALSWMGRACILTVPVALNLGAFLGRMNVGFDAGDHCRRNELVVGINDKQLARPVEDNAPPRPVLVFVGPHQGAQGGIDSPVVAPVRPGFGVARAVGETIAVWLGLVQRTTCGEQPRFGLMTPNVGSNIN